VAVGVNGKARIDAAVELLRQHGYKVEGTNASYATKTTYKT
jgi:hypothetical protein